MSNENLVTLIRVAEKDPEVISWLTALLYLDNYNRKSVLNTFLQKPTLEQAPMEFISAIQALLDDQTAQAALKLLTNGASDQRNDK